MSINFMEKFDLSGKIALITGGVGLMGKQHADAIASAGGVPILWDINEDECIRFANEISMKYDIQSLGQKVDITNQRSIIKAFNEVLNIAGKVDILINNAANDPKVEKAKNNKLNRFENLDIEQWNNDISVGLTGAFLTSQVVGNHMAKNNSGVIVNIGSDLSIISPDQRLYKQQDTNEDDQPVKPITYSVIKHGIIGLTKYLATYWAEKNIRVNSISPGGIYNDQPDEFVTKISSLIPLGRMANKDEYKSAIVFLCSDASSYMTGANLVIDGGRTCW